MTSFVKGLVVAYDESKDINIYRHVKLTYFRKWITRIASKFVTMIVFLICVYISKFIKKKKTY